MVVAFAVIVFMQAEGAVAVEIFEVAVERESRSKEREFIRRAAAERGRGEQGAECEFEFHGEPSWSPTVSHTIMKDR